MFFLLVCVFYCCCFFIVVVVAVVVTIIIVVVISAIGVATLFFLLSPLPPLLSDTFEGIEEEKRVSPRARKLERLLASKLTEFLDANVLYAVRRVLPAEIHRAYVGPGKGSGHCCFCFVCLFHYDYQICLLLFCFSFACFMEFKKKKLSEV